MSLGEVLVEVVHGQDRVSREEGGQGSCQALPVPHVGGEGPGLDQHARDSIAIYRGKTYVLLRYFRMCTLY